MNVNAIVQFLEREDNKFYHVMINNDWGRLTCKNRHIMFTYSIYNVSRALKLIPLALLNDSPFKSLFTHDRITAWNKLSQKIVNKLK